MFCCFKRRKSKEYYENKIKNDMEELFKIERELLDLKTKFEGEYTDAVKCIFAYRRDILELKKLTLENHMDSLFNESSLPYLYLDIPKGAKYLTLSVHRNL